MTDNQPKTRALLDKIEELIDKKHFEVLKSLLDETRSSDVAEIVEVVDEVARQVLFDLLGPKEAGEVLEKIDEATRSEIVQDMTSAELGEIVATLSPDDAADVMADFSKELTDEILEKMAKEESEQIEKLLRFDEESAGGIMNPVLLEINHKATVRDAIHAFRRGDPEEDYYSVFVVDDNHKLLGAISLPTLLKYSRSTPVLEIMEKDVFYVWANTDQEEVANIFRRNDLIVMPVVDKDGVLLGRITVDDIIDVMGEEAEEDAMVMAGTHPDELETHLSWRAASIRLPWLLVCLFFAIFSGVMSQGAFGDHFNELHWRCLLMFMPAIAAMGGNSGMQTSTVVVRGLATGDLAGMDIAQVFFRETRIAAFVATICAFFSGVLAMVWLTIMQPEDLPFGDGIMIGTAVGTAIFCCVILSTFMGMILPFFFKRIGIDPAVSSGPLVTTANDALSYVVYFSLALWLLSILS